MLKLKINQFKNWYVEIGLDNTASKDKAMRIKNFNWLLLWIMLASIVWSTLYFIIGQPHAAFIPLSTLIVIPISLFFFHKSKNFNIPINTFLVIMLILPALLQLFNGGLINSGAVISWSAMTPIIALAFKPKSQAKISLLFFILVVIATLSIELIALPDYKHFGNVLIEIQFAFNLVGVVVTAFFPLLLFTKELGATRRKIKNRNLTIDQSYKYAKYIQKSIIPSEIELTKTLKLNAFTLFKPKLKVGGDFYWAHSDEEQTIIVCGDCTGHGVPGAFMTLTAISHLNAIIKEGNERDPAVAMNLLHEKMLASFKTSGDIFNDSIKLSISVINKKDSTITYASTLSKVFVFNGIYLVRYRTDKSKVGDLIREVKFTNRTIKYKKGDILYLATDGFVNQFGERVDKKLNTRNFEDMMNKYGPFPFESQKKLYLKKLSKWQGKLDQTDDITFIGIEL